MELFIIKRDGKKEPFSIEKSEMLSQRRFFQSAVSPRKTLLVTSMSVNISDGISVEEVQNQVEVALMAEKYFAVAKSYMLYRQKHAEDREVSENSNS